MKSNSEVILLLLFLFQQNCDASESEVAIDYLKKFGYISAPGPGDIPQNSPGNNPGSGNTPDKPRNGSSESVAEAVKSFQKFAGLEATGKVDEDTLKLMKLPRCGVKDFVPGVLPGNIGRYQTQGSRWEKRSLTYRVTQYSRKMTGALVNADVKRAFKYWSDVTNLKFVSKERGDVDIEIGFFTFSHGDGDPFDGIGGTLAHAYFPRYGGDVHMDDSETWTENSHKGTNFLQTLTHEIGHSLGLSHSRVSASVMAPFYRGWDPAFKLHSDDIQGIQSLYGKPSVTTSPPIVFPTTKPTTKKPTTSPPSKQLGCPDMNTNTQGREIVGRLDDIRSWSSCSLKCSQSKGCKYWTWHHEKAVGYEYRCVLMSDFVNAAEDSNTISGSSDCMCPMAGINTQGRESSSMIGLEPSWQSCARKCSESASCSVWTWHPRSAGVYARRCVHMRGYSNLAADKNTISGTKGCTN